jgi:transposase
VPRNYGAHTSVIATISLGGAEAVMTVEESVDAEVFDAYVEQVLRPTFRRGDVMVLDNLSTHSREPHRGVGRGARGASNLAGTALAGLSPVELIWSKIEAAMRAAKAATREELEGLLTAALRLVTESDCRGWFGHCGYQVTSNCN